MEGDLRRKKIIELLSSADKPISGDKLASALGVSRQVVVQDMALLRANGVNIYSTNRGYLIEKSNDEMCARVFKVAHLDEQTDDEMNTIVDLGGNIIDVFVYHRVYGVIRGDLNVKSRLDVRNYMEKIRSGKSSLLKNVTSGYHYHTVMAESEQVLDMIHKELLDKGYLAPLSDYEPVDFWNK